MFGSDEPFYSQPLALARYETLPDQKMFLIDNYVALIQKAGLA